MKFEEIPFEMNGNRRARPYRSLAVTRNSISRDRRRLTGHTPIYPSYLPT